MTAHYLALSTHVLQKGETCLVHAAAGGVGGLLVQIARLRGARVIASVGSETKANIAREDGADEVILYRTQDVAAEVQRLTSGEGCRVVYDGVGKDTFHASLASTARRGMLVTYGNASGAVPEIQPLILANGSKYLTRSVLRDYIVTRDELLGRARDLFGWMIEGKLKLRIHREYPLAEAAQAHRDLESRNTIGKLLLIP
jgi:NADPH2:quinone reductase